MYNPNDTFQHGNSKLNKRPEKKFHGLAIGDYCPLCFEICNSNHDLLTQRISSKSNSSRILKNYESDVITSQCSREPKME